MWFVVWFVVVCGGLCWFAVVFGGLWYLVPHLKTKQLELLPAKVLDKQCRPSSDCFQRNSLCYCSIVLATTVMAAMIKL